MKSQKSEIAVASSIGPDQYTATTNGTGADLRGYESALVEIVTGTWGGTTPSATAKIQESSDNAAWTDVADANLDGQTGNPAGFALAASAVKAIGYTGTKRYLRAILSAVGGTTPVIRAAANVVAGNGVDRFRTAIARACKAAGVPVFSPHDLRHRRATLWHMQGVPAAEAAAWLGHSPNEHLATYAHVTLVDRSELDYSDLLDVEPDRLRAPFEAVS